jgi:hypothetical protein
LGVFATRSPFRPNAIGLSSVKICGIEHTQDYGTVIHVSGADLMDGTPISDVKPYIPYCDCHADATGGFTEKAANYILQVNFPKDLLEQLPKEKRDAVTEVLSHDPRPSYQRDPERIYGLSFSGFNIRFQVSNNILTVVSIDKL